MQKPQPGECREYFHKYIDLVPDGDYIEVLTQSTAEVILFFNNMATEKHEYRYADGKWTPKEVLLHVIDTERVFSYRALAAARGDNASLLPSMDENSYAASTDVSNRAMQDLTEEFAAVRTATAKLFANMTEEQTKQTANANGVNTTARAIGYMIIGHPIHHMNVIKERYL
jgi:uncharacterized damage-inducible protein DinB